MEASWSVFDGSLLRLFRGLLGRVTHIYIGCFLFSRTVGSPHRCLVTWDPRQRRFGGWDLRQGGKVGSERPETKPTFVASRTGRAFHSSGWGCRPGRLDHSRKMFEFPCAVTRERSAAHYYPSSSSDHPWPPHRRGHVWLQASFGFKEEKRKKKKSGHEMRFVSAEEKKRKLKTSCWR